MARTAPEKEVGTTPTCNHVTLFSNGLGHFRRFYNIPVGKQEKISIPFKRDHVSDVLASLSVFGNVKYDSPPSFTPTNSNATALQISPEQSMREMVKALRGAQVTVNMLPNRGDKRSATLAGVETHEVQTANGIATSDYLVLVAGGSVTKVAMNEIASIYFEDESVRSEINKALKNAFQKIKPDSTFLDLSLSGLNAKDETAVVQYTVPVAAWKMRYNIRKDGGTTLLEGTAIIDNSTDEDWDNFVISVVTGNPISFSTDLAEIRVPGRAHINLVDTNTFGNVTVEEGYAVTTDHGGGYEACAAPAPRSAMSFAKGAVASQNRRMSSMSNCAQFGLEAGFSAADCELESVAAAAPGVETKEVGDFCVFTSKEPITIASKRSAVVPMFTVPLTKCGSVLIYKERDHARRPWRAVKFKNETDFSLGKGKVVIYQDGVFSGECVMDTAKPGENRMLPHCLENGVKVLREGMTTEAKSQSLRLSAGVAYQETLQTAVTHYTVENSKDEDFNMLVEHPNVLANSSQVFSGVKVEETEKTRDGVRAYFVVKAKEKMKLTVTETLTYNQHFILHNLGWLQTNVITAKHPLATDKGVLACVEIQKQIDAVNADIKKYGDRKTELVQQVERVRENLRATKDEAATQIRTQWVTDLDDSEKEIRKIDKVFVPDLDARLKELTTKLGEALKQLTAVWKA